jgi:hypothetical protein
MFVDVPEVFLHRDVVDFRKSINGLVGIVEGDLERDAYSGALFVFCNKSRDKLKIIYWDKTGKADVVLSLIGKLYGIEAHIKAKSSDEKYQTRQEKSKPIIDKINQWIIDNREKTAKKESIKKVL